MIEGDYGQEVETLGLVFQDTIHEMVSHETGLKTVSLILILQKKTVSQYQKAAIMMKALFPNHL